MRRITPVLYAAVVQGHLPLFPLTTALVPGLVLPLHVFEPRYRQLVEELLAIPDEDDREFGIIAVREGHDPSREGLDALYPIGTTAVLRTAERLDDGRFDIVTTGGRRFAVAELDLSSPLIRATVDFLDDITCDADEAVALRVRRVFSAYRTLLSGQVEGLDSVDEHGSGDGLPDDPTVISYLVTAATVLPVDERQSLLAAPTTHDRLRLAERLLRREVGLISALGALPALEPSSAEPSAN